MVDVNALKQAAKVVTDENGNPVVQIPLETWNELVEPEFSSTFQRERLRELLAEWEKEPLDVDEAWWDDFRQFLAENRMNFPERDLDWED